MLTLAITVKLIAEVALLALLGQLLLGLLVPAPGRDRNFFYQILSIAGKPFLALARVLFPASVANRNLPLLAVLMLAMVWLGATVAKIQVCLQTGVNLCK